MNALERGDFPVAVDFVVLPAVPAKMPFSSPFAIALSLKRALGSFDSPESPFFFEFLGVFAHPNVEAIKKQDMTFTNKVELRSNILVDHNSPCTHNLNS